MKSHNKFRKPLFFISRLFLTIYISQGLQPTICFINYIRSLSKITKKLAKNGQKISPASFLKPDILSNNAAFRPFAVNLQ